MHRLILEASMHGENAFLTLTYNDDKIPEGQTLVPKHVTDFLKRLRKNYEPKKLRYFAVGEYGDKTSRPHYHLALFGHPSCLKGRTYIHGDRICCSVCRSLLVLWGHGNIFAGDLNKDSAGYISGYVTKKMTKKDDPRLEGRHPEFTRMSLRPGIGADMMDEVASKLLELNLEHALEDVPTSLEHERKMYPLGKYLRRRLRQRIGRSEKAPEVIQQKQKDELQPLWEIADANAPPNQKANYVRALIIQKNVQKTRQLEQRQRRSKKDML